MQAKPFLRWVGGKKQLIADIQKVLPIGFNEEKLIYVEPFVGGGTVLFWMLNNFPNIEEVIINDINYDLTNTYKIVSSKPNQLISILKDFEKEYHGLLNNADDQKAYFYNKREVFNSRSTDKVTQAALFLFLNRTCFNGLYRVNKDNEFNVPIGSYKKPIICDEENILAVSIALQKVTIMTGDYEKTLKKLDKSAFFYFDPPYKPLSKTSSFVSYSNQEFDDNEQIRLYNFCKKIDDLGHSWLLSNSDVKNLENLPHNNFFDDLYRDFQIDRVSVKRIINTDPEKRGQLSELLIYNQK